MRLAEGKASVSDIPKYTPPVAAELPPAKPKRARPAKKAAANKTAPEANPTEDAVGL
jgi:hypothetical protein